MRTSLSERLTHALGNLHIGQASHLCLMREELCRTASRRTSQDTAALIIMGQVAHGCKTSRMWSNIFRPASRAETKVTRPELRAAERETAANRLPKVTGGK